MLITIQTLSQTFTISTSSPLTPCQHSCSEMFWAVFTGAGHSRAYTCAGHGRDAGSEEAMEKQERGCLFQPAFECCGGRPCPGEVKWHQWLRGQTGCTKCGVIFISQTILERAKVFNPKQHPTSNPSMSNFANLTARPPGIWEFDSSTVPLAPQGRCFAGAPGTSGHSLLSSRPRSYRPPGSSGQTLALP